MRCLETSFSNRIITDVLLLSLSQNHLTRANMSCCTTEWPSCRASTNLLLALPSLAKRSLVLLLSQQKS